MTRFKDIKITVDDSFKQNISDEGSSCSESEPFALQVIDQSMEPEFEQGCIIIIDPTGIVRDGAFVFAKDNQDEYIFRRLRINAGRYYLEALQTQYPSLEIRPEQIQGIVTQRAGKRRSYHKWYD
ncbi:S24 family peptidase [uncultured Thiothrix sp.]|jgi:SOS-response transcriptional repressor LexA|uniref:S24 family peptidase n=1 Tax=uncultured Thiothrix sp. TaxID=223185 RepID=UPI0026016714|nr:S24 family peptidase [uncultured Thiothrix sp.]HMT94052.1 S24 family peptidase [Thiolinea sp.]